MTRLFHTTVQTGPVEFEVSEVHCTKVSLGSLDNKSYRLHAGGNSPLLLIDAATEPRRLLGMMAGRPLGVVVSTHRHADHLQALAEVIAQTGAKPFAGRADAEAIAQQTGVASHQVWTGDQIGCGGVSLEVIGLVGHTPGSIALVLRGTGTGPTHIFSGDSLFPGGVGKTDSPADFASLLDDVTGKIFDRFCDQTIIHPGHGDSTTLGAERPQLAQWRARGW